MGKKNKGKDDDVDFAESPAKKRLYNLAMEAMVMQAEEMGADAIEAGRKSFTERLKMEGIEYNATTITALKAGMEFMMLADMKGREEGKDIKVLALSIAAKLQKVEQDMENTAKAPTPVV